MSIDWQFLFLLKQSIRFPLSPEETFTYNNSQNVKITGRIANGYVEILVILLS